MFLIGLGFLVFSVTALISFTYTMKQYSSAGYIIAEGTVTTIYIFFVALAVVGIVLMVVGLLTGRKKARTVIQVKYTNREETQRNVSEVLQKKHYKQKNVRGEDVFKCGTGLLTAMKYIKIEYAENNTMVISGWIRPVGGNEQNLDGTFVCVVPKKQVLKVIDEIKSQVR